MLLKEVNFTAVWDDSRRVTPGSLFAALPGAKGNGEAFIESAIQKGAGAVLLKSGSEAKFVQKYPQVVFIPVSDPCAEFRGVVERFYGAFSCKVKTIGITGTNGKTTITYLLESIIKAAGKKTGVVGTVNCRINDKVFPSKNTTPGFLDNQMFLASLAKEGVDYAVMEVSSHALAQGRVDLIDFNGGVFTNLTGDHLDFHGTMENYFEAKSLLFRSLSRDAYAVINTDDEWGRKLVSSTSAKVFSYGIDQDALIRARVHEFGLKGSIFDIQFPGGAVAIKTVFTGKHNVYNILAAFAAGLGEGFSPEVIKKGIEALHNVPGRLERVEGPQDFHVFIDYAHTDDGLKNVLEALVAVRHKRLIVVFGAGGDRDKTKRPRMGKVACDLADYSILTSDNPRSEDPRSIIEEIIPGFTQKTYEVVVDRKDAIARALAMAQKGDIILLAGKGHETYQVLKDKTIDFVERDIVTGILSKG
ncbi:MAG: UDP-N-acetylmuramoyl-L-alanyl-D-glutamate--2,6-diaminopimelate ligase [Candidatus Omnitrophica bacterium]|nr:UDP-N-acetylmuramoyl-L-alanyl-D-glutamate--2,6-diaminopimelate ligase [Candidatus Omnitrophota bacterium]